MGTANLKQSYSQTFYRSIKWIILFCIEKNAHSSPAEWWRRYWFVIASQFTVFVVILFSTLYILLRRSEYVNTYIRKYLKSILYGWFYSNMCQKFGRRSRFFQYLKAHFTHTQTSLPERILDAFSAVLQYQYI